MKKNILLVALSTMFLWSCNHHKDSELSAWKHPKNDTVFSIDSITQFVNKVCDTADHAYYTEPKDRIAVFDMDGTIACEWPFSMETYCAYYLAYGKLPIIGKHPNIQAIEDSILKKKLSSDQLINRFKDLTDTLCVTNNYIPYSDSTAPKRKLCNLFYKPMVELINYLQSNSFQVYIVSGSSQQFILGVIQNIDSLHIDPSHVIGSLETKDSVVYFTHQGPEFYPRNNKPFENSSKGKALNIYYRINKVPIFAFGNTVHDFDMFALTSSKKNAHTMCILLNHDDNSYEACYEPYDTADTINKDWTGWPSDSLDKWDSTKFHQILTSHNWHEINISESFKKDSMFEN